jgi:heterodisulfide reductase subunit C
MNQGPGATRQTQDSIQKDLAGREWCVWSVGQERRPSRERKLHFALRSFVCVCGVCVCVCPVPPQNYKYTGRSLVFLFTAGSLACRVEPGS